MIEINSKKKRVNKEEKIDKKTIGTAGTIGYLIIFLSP